MYAQASGCARCEILGEIFYLPEQIMTILYFDGFLVDILLKNDIIVLLC